MKYIFFFEKSKKIANEILYNFRLMLLFEVCTINGLKIKKKTAILSKMRVLNTYQFIEDHTKKVVFIGQRPKNDQ